MPLSWNEIKRRATAFSREWENEISEDAEAKTFWDEFFNIFGITRRRVATFETRVTTSLRKGGKIDLLWKGEMLVEHKSAGKNLYRAYQQAIDYFPGLKEHELPKYIVVCNFQEFKVYNLDDDTVHEFELKDLTRNIELFGFIAGYQKRTFRDEDPVNIEAAELMGQLHDQLKEIGYADHPLEVYLVRLLFCLFADDTGIFEKGIFQEYIRLKTHEDGSDLAFHLSGIFNILNTDRNSRLKNIDEHLNAFPFVNGKLFSENLPLASFDSDMRRTLLKCCTLDWGKISPAIFGSMFQSVMDSGKRRNLGAHYTSEKNIMKVIRSLFLDDLWEEFHRIKSDRRKLVEFHNRIAKLRFLDPACGCGNFLVITYRELRLLEIEILKVLYKGETGIIQHGIEVYAKMDVDQFYGIEVEEFPAQIAQVAMWLMDHQMNMVLSAEFGEYFVRLPLKKSATIVHGNALRMDWESIILQTDNSHIIETDTPFYNYIFGNPPFIGKNFQNKEQKNDLANLFKGVDGSGNMDYVTGWYIKASQYLKKFNTEEINTSGRTKVAFVSTNSVTQGEQVGILWNELFNRYHIKIHFAHRTFKWSNEAKGNAAVHVVIIGFSNFDIQDKYIFEYLDINSDANKRKVSNVNPYLVEGKDIFLLPRIRPINQGLYIIAGNKAVDGGNLIFSDIEKEQFIAIEPLSKKYFKQFIGSEEFINGKSRWCLWLVDVDPDELRKMPNVLERIKRVKDLRLNSIDLQARKLANFPATFRDKQNPERALIIPLVSSENRKYIPFGFIDKSIIPSNLCSFIKNPTLYHFGIITSKMHMVWVNHICGRLESRYRYSNTIVYNNFPWPENPSEKQKQKVEEAANLVLEVRRQFPGSSLADLYDPITMPPALVKAHQELDKAVDQCYRSQAFTSDAQRMEFLFELYDKYVYPLIPSEKKSRKKPKS